MNGNNKSMTWSVGMSEGHSHALDSQGSDSTNIGITPFNNLTHSHIRSRSISAAEQQTYTESNAGFSEEEWKKTRDMFRDIFHVAPIVLRDLADVTPSDVSVSHAQLQEIARTLADIFEVFYEDLTS